MFAGESVPTATSLCSPFLVVLPVEGAAVSTLGAPIGSETVCATDAQAARLDEVQFDLGEGPCWEAKFTRRPVLTADMRGDSHDAWPVFAEAISNDDIGALYTFPLLVGPLSFGAVDLYSRSAGRLNESQIAYATGLAENAARQVLQWALSVRETHTEDADDTQSEYSRRVVHQATGMVIAQLDVSAADALLILRGHAFAHARPVREIAVDLVERRLDLSHVHDEVGD
jgi:hypothetical protein